MNLSEQIKLATKALGDKRESLVALTAALEATPNDQTIVTQVDTLAGEIETETKGLEALQRAERALAVRALPILGGPGAPLILPTAREKGSLELLVRGAVVAAESYHTRRPVADVLKERYGDAGEATRIVSGLVTKAAQGPAMTTVAGYAAELVQQTYAAFMAALTGPAAVPAIPWANVGTFDGGAPIVVPYRKQRAAFPANFDAAFRKEGDPIRVGSMQVGALSMHPYGMGVIGTFTKELFKEVELPNIEAVMRDAILEDTAEALDGYVLGNSPAVVDLRPKGLTSGLAPEDTHASSGATYPQIEFDLQKCLVQMFTVRRLGKAPVWVMNTANKMALLDKVNPLGVYVFREELNGGRLKGLPVVASLNVALDTVLLVDGGSIAFAGGVPLFEGSDVATLHEESAAPLPIGSAGAPATIAAPARSLFQTNSAAIKTTWDVSWLELHVGAVQAITGCVWNPAIAPTGLGFEAFGGTPAPARNDSAGRATRSS